MKKIGVIIVVLMIVSLANIVIAESINISNIYNIDWFKAKESGIFPKIDFIAGKTAYLTDLRTGISFKIKIFTLENHMDVEPLTGADTEKICQVYGVANASSITSSRHDQRRPMLINTGIVKAVCSMYGVPHGKQTILDNIFPGSFCLHFLGSKTAGTDRVDNGHRNAIEEAIRIQNNNGKSVLLLNNASVEIEEHQNIPIDEEHFPDPIFRKYICEQYDSFPDNILDLFELDAITRVRIGGGLSKPEYKMIRSLKGIEFFYNLKEIYCSYAKVTEIDLSHNKALVEVSVPGNELVCLDLNNNPQVSIVSCFENIRKIELDGNTYDLGLLGSAFDVNKAYDWQGATINGNTLEVFSNKVTYRYDCGMGVVTQFTLLPVNIQKPHKPEVIWPDEIRIGETACFKVKADKGSIETVIEIDRVLEDGSAEKEPFGSNGHFFIYDDIDGYVYLFNDEDKRLIQGERYIFSVFSYSDYYDESTRSDVEEKTYTVKGTDYVPSSLPTFSLNTNAIIYPNVSDSFSKLELKFEKDISGKVIVDIERNTGNEYYPERIFIFDSNDPLYQNNVYQYSRLLDPGSYTVRAAYLGENGNALGWTERQSFIVVKGLEPPFPRIEIEQTWNAGQDVTGRITNKVPKARYLVNSSYKVDEDGHFIIPGHDINSQRLTLSVSVSEGYGYASTYFSEVTTINILGNKKRIESIVTNKQRAKLNEEVVFTINAAGASKIRVENAKLLSNSEKTEKVYLSNYDYEYNTTGDATNITLNALSDFQSFHSNKWNVLFTAYIDGVWTDWYQAPTIELYSEGVLSSPVYLGPKKINQGNDLIVSFSEVENAKEYTVEVSDAPFSGGETSNYYTMPELREEHLFVEQVGSTTSYTFDSSLFNDQKCVYVNIIARAPGYVPSRSYQDTIVYIVRNATHCTVLFEGNGSDSGEMNQQIITSDSRDSMMLAPNEFSRAGYVFSGWNTNPDGSGEWFEDQADMSGLLLDGISSVTLYAQWIEMKDVLTKPIVLKLESVPESLSGIFQSVDQIKQALLSKIQMRNEKVAVNYELYDVVLMISLNNGLTWIPATQSNFPQDGIKIVLPYPQGTGMISHIFKVAHMFTADFRGRYPAEIETPPVTNTEQGIEVVFNGLSPVLLAWKEVGSHTDMTFEGTVKWLVSGEHPEHKLRLFKDGQKEHVTIAAKMDENTWIHRAEDLSYGSDYYAMVDAIPGYYMEYQNVGEYAEIKDKLYDRGTVLIIQIPPTGDRSKIMFHVVITLMSFLGLLVFIHKDQRKCRR